jgi:hypothetical protein
MHTNNQKLLMDWQDEVATSLVEGFRQLFESSSQVLLEFADAAENNRLQRLFFDAQREFYLKEEIIVEVFEKALRDDLSDFCTRSCPRPATRRRDTQPRRGRGLRALPGTGDHRQAHDGQAAGALACAVPATVPR